MSAEPGHEVLTAIFDDLQRLAMALDRELEDLPAQLALPDAARFSTEEVARRAERALARSADVREALGLLRAALGV